MKRIIKKLCPELEHDQDIESIYYKDDLYNILKEINKSLEENLLFNIESKISKVITLDSEVFNSLTYRNLYQGYIELIGKYTVAYNCNKDFISLVNKKILNIIKYKKLLKYNIDKKNNSRKLEKELLFFYYLFQAYATLQSYRMYAEDMEKFYTNEKALLKECEYVKMGRILNYISKKKNEEDINPVYTSEEYDCIIQSIRMDILSEL